MSRYFDADWEIIPNGVDLVTFARSKRDHGASVERPRLLYLGRFEPRNGLDTLLSALPRIQTRFPHTELIAAGSGPWAAAYRRRAERADLPVRFLGSVHQERPALYQQADLYLCPTTRASFGITLLEAMACGTPMVVSDIPAFREVAGQHSRLVQPKAPAAWADAIVNLLRDPNSRLAMSNAGSTAARHYDWWQISQRILAVYQRVTSR